VKSEISLDTGTQNILERHGNSKIIVRYTNSNILMSLKIAANETVPNNTPCSPAWSGYSQSYACACGTGTQVEPGGAGVG